MSPAHAWAKTGAARSLRIGLWGAALFFFPHPTSAQTMDHAGIGMEMPAKVPASTPQPAGGDAHPGHGRGHGAGDDAQPPADDEVTGHGGRAATADGKAPPPGPADAQQSGSGHRDGNHPDAGQAGAGRVRPASPAQPRTPIPLLTDADRAAAFPPLVAGGHAAHDDTIHSFMLLDRFEGWKADSGTGLLWEGTGWIGTDLNRLWLRSEGEQVGGRLEDADVEALYGRAIAPWWDLVAGIRHDFKPGTSQDFAAVGVQGLAPYKFEVQATAYLGPSGRTAARFELAYDTLLTNRLILQPLIEANLYGQNDARRSLGSGLSTVEAGLRLRYEIRREFAPYLGVVHARAFGDTADFLRAEGQAVDDTRWVLGLRLWF